MSLSCAKGNFILIKKCFLLFTFDILKSFVAPDPMGRKMESENEKSWAKHQTKNDVHILYRQLDFSSELLTKFWKTSLII